MSSKDKYLNNLEQSPSEDEKKKLLQQMLNTPISQYGENENNNEAEKESCCNNNIEDNQEVDEEIDEEEVNKLRNKLLTLALKNPEILQHAVNYDIKRQIDSMTSEELQMRILHARNINMRKIDGVINRKAIEIINSLVGGIFNCVDELNDQTMTDEMLLETTGEIISEYLPDIPAHLRAAGIYGLHVSSALAKSHLKKEKQDDNKETHSDIQ